MIFDEPRLWLYDDWWLDERWKDERMTHEETDELSDFTGSFLQVILERGVYQKSHLNKGNKCMI